MRIEVIADLHDILSIVRIIDSFHKNTHFNNFYKVCDKYHLYSIWGMSLVLNKKGESRKHIVVWSLGNDVTRNYIWCMSFSIPICVYIFV